MKYIKIKHYYYLKEVDSTSFELKRHIHEVSNLTFIRASYQTNGKGRTSHTWESKRDENLLFSFAIKDKDVIQNFNILSLALAVSIHKVLTNLHIDNVSIKWPNDVYIGEKKVCGILMEGELPSYIIVGIGLNVNQKEFDGLNATSIASVLGIKQNINHIKKLVFAAIKKDLHIISKDSQSFINYVNHFNFLLNKEVSYTLSNHEYKGKVKAINSDGSLLIINNGISSSISCGEINLSN